MEESKERTRRFISDYTGASQTPGNGYRSALSGTTDYLSATNLYSSGRYRACRC